MKKKTEKFRKEMMQMEKIIRLYLKEACRYELLSAEEERELAKRKRKGDQKATEKLVCSNLLLVVKIAKKFLNKGLGLDDLIQAGNEGLMKAVRKYDGRPGNRLSSYAGWWIWVYIQKELIESGATKIPFYFNARISKVIKAERNLKREAGSVSASEIARYIGMSEKEVNEIKRVIKIRRPVSLNEKVNEKKELIDFLDDQGKDDEAKKQAELRREIIKAWEKLAPREARILYLRTNYDPKNRDKSCFRTYKEIAEELGITIEWVRQLYLEAIKKLNTSKKFVALRELYNEL